MLKSNNVYWNLGNKDKNQLQLDVHFGITNPMKDVKSMANLMQTANEYVAPETKNIADLKRVPVTLELFTKTVHEGEEDEFSYDYILIEDIEYRVPKPVISQLKKHIEAKPELKEFSVAKEGTGLKTTYTVIPL